MAGREAGIPIKLDAPEVDARWRDIIPKLGEIGLFGIGAYLGDTNSMAGSVNATKGLFDSVSLQDSDETKAYRLVILSIATAVSDLSATSLSEAQQEAAQKSFEAFRKKISKVLENDSHVLSPKFFDNPSNLPLYQEVRKELIAALKTVRLEKKKTINHIGGKLDKAFNSSVFNILRAQAQYFQTLLPAIETKGRDVLQHELNWDAYRAHLIHQFEIAPVFGQEETKVSLSQLYIAPRAQWFEKADDEDGEPETKAHTVWLTENINAWIEAGSSSNTIKLIHGGPGRGKSTFAKALAAELAVDEGVQPLFIELQNMPWDSKLIDGIGDYFTQVGEHFQINPLSSEFKNVNRPFVLIFDGLDELARPGGRGADELARDFSRALELMLLNLNNDNALRALVIITGRDSIIQALQSCTQGLPPQNALESSGYAPISKNKTEKNELVDQRTEWWKQFASATGKAAKVPLALTTEKLEDLSNEPLLCYLMGLADIAKNWKAVADNPNLLYQDLLYDVWDRKWGGGKKGPAESFTSEEDFNLLMETMGLAAWHGDGSENRIATLDGFENACTVTYATKVWEKFQGDHGQDLGQSLSSLALTFYFKRANADSQGIEFGHKSFSEYLVARLLFRSALELAEDYDRPRSNSEVLLKDWLKLAGQTCIDDYIFPFIRNEARTRTNEELIHARNNLEKLFNTIIQDGMPAHKENSITWRRAEQIQRNGLIAFLACFNAIIRELFIRIPKTPLVSPDWGADSTEPARFIRRLIDSHGSQEYEYISLSHMDFTHSHSSFLNSIFLPLAKLERTNFQSSNLMNAVLTFANLSDANLSDTNLRWANLRGTNLIRANLRGADLTETNLDQVNLSQADLTKTRLVNANLTNAELTGANLTGVNLRAANMTGATIIDSILPKNWKDKVIFDKDTPPSGKPAKLV